MFTALVTSMEESVQQKLFFDFKRILSAQELAARQQEEIRRFRKRNNPSEDD